MHHNACLPHHGVNLGEGDDYSELVSDFRAAASSDRSAQSDEQTRSSSAKVVKWQLPEASKTLWARTSSWDFGRSSGSCESHEASRRSSGRNGGSLPHDPAAAGEARVNP